MVSLERVEGWMLSTKEVHAVLQSGPVAKGAARDAQRRLVTWLEAVLGPAVPGVSPART